MSRVYVNGFWKITVYNISTVDRLFINITFLKLKKVLVSQNPDDYNLPNGYTFASNPWGDSFYKAYFDKMTYHDAVSQCESDGALLAFPRSEAENNFIANLFPSTGFSILIGINDIDEEGNFVSIDGRDLVFTKWDPSEPNDYNNNEDAATIGKHESRGWNDVPVTHKYKFVCFYEISS